MKYLLTYIKPFYRRMARGLTIKVFGTLIELLIPYILSYIIDEVVPQGSVVNIVFWGIMMIACALAGVTMSVTANRMAAKVSSDICEIVRRHCLPGPCKSRVHDKFTI